MKKIHLTISLMLLSAGFAQPAYAAAADSLERELREQRSAVRTAENAVAQRVRAQRDAYQALERVRQPFEEARLARLRADEAIAAHKAVLDVLEDQEARLIDQFAAEVDAGRVGPHRNALDRRISAVQAQRARMASDSAYLDRLAQLQASWSAADDDYWEMRRQWEHALQQVALAEGALAHTEQQLSARQTRLTDLRIEAMQASSEVLPTYLSRVAVTQSGTTVYAAEWIERRVEIDEQITVLRDLRDDQENQVYQRRAGFDAAYQELEQLGAQMDALSAEYENAIHAQAWRTILTQLGGATANIVLNGGNAVSVFTELASRLADIPMTDYRARYDLPVLGQGALHSAESRVPVGGSVATDAAINRYKEVVLELVQGFVGGTIEIEDLGGLRAEVWVRPKLDAMASRSLGDVARSAKAQLLSVRSGAEASALIKQHAQRTLRDVNYRQLGRNIGTGFLVDVAEGAVLDEARAARVAVFERWVAFDTEVAAGRLALHTQRVMWQQDRAQLQAIHRALNELLDLRNTVSLERVLRVTTNEQIERETPAEIQLTFSRDVERVVVDLAAERLPSTGENRAYTASLSPQQMTELPKLTYLGISARDVLQQRRLDRQPETKPFLNERAVWENYEPGSDAKHLLNFGAEIGNASIGLVLDLSGSMETHMAAHINSLREALRNPVWREADEFALWVFQGTEIRLLQPFTVDRARIENALQNLRADGGTPLARAIIQSGSHLLASGRHNNKHLLIFTDGEDTEGRDPTLAIRQLQANSVNAILR